MSLLPSNGQSVGLIGAKIANDLRVSMYIGVQLNPALTDPPLTDANSYSLQVDFFYFLCWQ